MADDTFEREVNEQIRQDRAQELWDKYGKFVIGAAVLIVLATAAFTGWNYYQETRSASFGDRFMEAIELSNQGNHDEAMEALQTIGAEGSGEYPALAKMRIAGEMAARGEAQAALAAFDEIANDNSYSEIFRQIATLRAGILAVDLEGYGEVEDRLSALAETGNAFRHSAREALGIAAMKAGDDASALEWFTAIAQDAASPGGVRARTEIMLNMLAGKGVTAEG